MASLLAIKLRRRVEAYLGRGLKVKQVRSCEEIIINFKPWVPFRYLEGLEKPLPNHRNHRHHWGLFYYPLYAMARSFRGYTRRDDLVFIIGRMARIYQQCDLLGGEGYGEKDLAAILFLANECTDNEINVVFIIAQTYGLRTLRHLRGIILKNRAITVQPNLQPFGLDKDETLVAKVASWVKSTYPVVGSLQELYKKRLDMCLSRNARMRFVWDEMAELDQKGKHGGLEDEWKPPA